METAITAAVTELVKLGAPALPWIVMLIVCGAQSILIKWLAGELLKTQGVLISIIQSTAQADKDQAVEYRRLVDVVQQGRRSQ